MCRIGSGRVRRGYGLTIILKLVRAGIADTEGVTCEVAVTGMPPSTIQPCYLREAPWRRLAGALRAWVSRDELALTYALVGAGIAETEGVTCEVAVAGMPPPTIQPCFLWEAPWRRLAGALRARVSRDELPPTYALVGAGIAATAGVTRDAAIAGMPPTTIQPCLLWEALWRRLAGSLRAWVSRDELAPTGGSRRRGFGPRHSGSVRCRAWSYVG